MRFSKPRRYVKKRKTYKVLETLQEEKYRARHPELVSEPAPKFIRRSNMFEFNITLEAETSSA